MKDVSNVALIPVRGGSKSIPLKNIKNICGQPLVYWVMDAAVDCRYIDKVYISTDSEIIKEKVLEYKQKNMNLNRNVEKVKCIGRSESTATDEASTESAMLEFSENYLFDNIVLIQATSPLLTTADLDNAFKKYLDNKYDSLLSVVEQRRFIWREEKDGLVQSVNYNPNNRPRRQEFKGFLVENGAFYITKRELLLSTKTRISGNIGYYIMPEETYFEIDEPSDWSIIESLMRSNKKQNIKFSEKLSKIKLVAMDCDGVLTDGGMYYSENGDELKKFNTKDGMGIGLLHKAGLITVIITGEDVDIVKNRANKLKIKEVHLGIKDKLKCMNEIIEKYHLSIDEVLYIGDDINDLNLLENVGISVAVADSLDIVKENADYITKAKGGKGAVREVAELVLKAKEKVIL